MGNNILYAIYLVLFVFFVLAIRMRWMSWKVEEYRSDIIFFCVITNKSAEYGDELSKIWALRTITFDLLNWDFKKYVIDQEKYEQLQDFLNSQLDKEHLDMEDMLEKIERESKKGENQNE